MSQSDFDRFQDSIIARIREKNPPVASSNGNNSKITFDTDNLSSRAERFTKMLRDHNVKDETLLAAMGIVYDYISLTNKDTAKIRPCIFYELMQSFSWASDNKDHAICDWAQVAYTLEAASQNRI